MTELWLIKSENGNFQPLNEDDRDKADKIPVMEENCFTLKRIRHGKHHRKYMSMMRMAFNNQDEFDDEDTFRKYIQMRAGYYEVVKVQKDGETITMHWPKSIAFDTMDQTAFKEIYDKAWAVLAERYGFDNELFLAELGGYA